MSQPVVRVYQEDWWPFQNLPHALKEFERQTGIKTELSWDKVGVGLIEAMFEHMIHSFTDDDPPYDLICTDEIMLRRFAAEGRVLVLNDLMARDGVTLDDVTAETRRAVTLGAGDRPALLQRLELPPLSPRSARPLFAARAAKLGRVEGHRRRTSNGCSPRRHAGFLRLRHTGRGGRRAFRLEGQQLPRIVRRALAFR